MKLSYFSLSHQCILCVAASTPTFSFWLPRMHDEFDELKNFKQMKKFLITDKFVIITLVEDCLELNIWAKLLNLLYNSCFFSLSAIHIPNLSFNHC